MASRFSLNPIPVGKFPKHPQHIPLFAFPPLGFHSKHICFETVSSFGGGLPKQALRAVKEEVIESPNSESTHGSQTTTSSSNKLVLVLGGSGGVGKALMVFSFSLKHMFIKYIEFYMCLLFFFFANLEFWVFVILIFLCVYCSAFVGCLLF